MRPAQAFGRWLRLRREAREMGIKPKEARAAKRHAKQVAQLYDPPSLTR